MRQRERAICALTGGTPDYVPTFELAFYLTEEVFGERYFQASEWEGQSEKERERMLRHNAQLYAKVAEKYQYSMIMVGMSSEPKDLAQTAQYISEMTDHEYLLVCHGDATYGIPAGNQMLEFTYWLYDHPEEAKEEATRKVDAAIERAKYLLDSGFDGFALCTDYCFNNGPYLPPAKFAEFVTPYLQRLIRTYKEMGAYVIKHTDGDIMPIIDQLIACEPHALHSLDPMAGVDIKEVKAKYGDKVCLIGNVDCSLLQTGTREEMVQSAQYALASGKPGGGYIFGTSNCAFAGMPVESYHLIHDIWKRERFYS